MRNRRAQAEGGVIRTGSNPALPIAPDDPVDGAGRTPDNAMVYLVRVQVRTMRFLNLAPVTAPAP